MAKPLENYVEVSERITLFYEKYPEGSLRCKSVYALEIGEHHFLVYIAQAFRTPDDQAPAEGSAWEPVPGKTNFTRDSELMNAETSAWGRAIAALGFEVKRGIASRQEVMNRRDIGGNGAAAPPEAAGSPHLSAPSAVASGAARGGDVGGGPSSTGTGPKRAPSVSRSDGREGAPAADVTASPQEKAALSRRMNALQIPSSTQQAVVHAIAGKPPTQLGLKHISELLSDPSALFREAGVERPANLPDSEGLPVGARDEGTRL